jgi:dienelactone hydrolase
MNERALTFGDERHLVGILTEPESVGTGGEGSLAGAGDDDHRPGVIFLNSGILHRVGASRIYVKLARRLAAEGWASFRFDHAGIGDSDVRRDDRSFLESAMAEAGAAMDLLEERNGIRRFVLAGLCSGADMAYWVALEDERVVGLVQIDPFVYRNRKATLRHYLPRLLSPAAWGRSIRARTNQVVCRLRGQGGGEDPASSVWVAPEYTRIFPPRDELARGFQALRARGVAFWVFITGDMGEIVNYADQYAETFHDVPWGDALHVDFAPGANHTVTGLPDQKRVAEGVARWMAGRWGGRDESLQRAAEVVGS